MIHCILYVGIVLKDKIFCMRYEIFDIGEYCCLFILWLIVLMVHLRPEISSFWVEKRPNFLEFQRTKLLNHTKQ